MESQQEKLKEIKKKMEAKQKAIKDKKIIRKHGYSDVQK